MRGYSYLVQQDQGEDKDRSSKALEQEHTISCRVVVPVGEIDSEISFPIQIISPLLTKSLCYNNIMVICIMHQDENHVCHK